LTLALALASAPLAFALWHCQWHCQWVQAAVTAAERQALVNLYTSTRGSTAWRTTSGWTVGDPCSGNWFGVGCNVAQTSVRYANHAHSRPLFILGHGTGRTTVYHLKALWSQCGLAFALLSSHFQVKPTHNLHTTTDKLSRHAYTLPCPMRGGSYDAVDTIDVQAPCWVATRQCGGYSR
jgi:hypothetical protein